MILITGGTGLLGSHLLYQLSQTEDKVRALVRSVSSIENTRKIFSYYTAQPELLLEKIDWVEGDILDIYSLEEALRGVEYVYHAAALVSFDPKDARLLMATNVTGTSRMVNASLAAKVKKFCYVSSIAALGRAGNTGITDEETEWKPDGKKLSPYALSKYEAEREVWRGMAEGLKAVIVNPSVILGPGDFSKGSSRMFQTVYDGLKFYTVGMNGYVDVNDVAQAMILLMQSNISGERFILNGGNMYYRDLFRLIAEALGKKAPSYKAGKLVGEATWRALKLISLFTGHSPLVTRQTARTANSIYRYSSEKFIKATGMSFTPLEETIKRTASLFLKNNGLHV